MPRFLFGAFVILSIAGCATVSPQTRMLLDSPPDVPDNARVDEVPMIIQSEGHCGPAALAMVMSWAGEPVAADQVKSEVYTPGGKGSLQMDMLSAGRRHGFLAIPFSGMREMIEEIAAGHPVIVLQNLGFSWAPKWHYAVVTGYDLKNQVVTLNSGEEQDKAMPMTYFERYWRLARYWGLLVLPADRLSVSASELQHMQAASALENLGNSKQAEAAYRAILKRWPESLPALFGLGNISYKNRDFKNAVEYLNLALKFHPDSAAARHNLKVAKAAAAGSSNSIASGRSNSFR